MTIGANPRYIEELRVGGGLGDPAEGGADFEKNGDISTDGNITLNGILTAGTSQQVLTNTAGKIDGSTIQAGSIDASALDQADTYTMGSVNISGNAWEAGTVKRYERQLDLTGAGWDEICEIDYAGVADFSKIALEIRVLSHIFDDTTVKRSGGIFGYFEFHQLTTHRYSWTAWGPTGNGSLQLKLRDMGSGVFQIWLQSVNTSGAFVRVTYTDTPGFTPDFSGFGTDRTDAADGVADVATNLDFRFSDNIFVDGGGTSVLAGDLDVRGGEIGVGTDAGARGVLTTWSGSGGSAPGAVKLHSPNGTAWYLFVEDDGTVKIHSALPTANSDGAVVGTQT